MKTKLLEIKTIIESLDEDSMAQINIRTEPQQDNIIITSDSLTNQTVLWGNNLLVNLHKLLEEYVITKGVK